MHDQTERLDPGQLPFQIGDALGEIKAADQPYPGVYYIATQKNEAMPMVSEYYIITKDTPIISQTVKNYGQSISGHPKLLAYSMSDDKSGWRLVEYEGLQYLPRHHLSIPEQESLHNSAIYSMEFHPEYFGDYPVPTITPAGYTLRYKQLDNGIHWLETDHCREMLSICYPVWNSELSIAALALGQQTEYDLLQGIKDTMGCLFFSRRDSCIPLFELLYLRDDWKTANKINVPALMNAIWKYYPEYAASHNLEEQFGANDLLGVILNTMGEDVELSGSVENVISMSPHAGTNFFQW